MKCIILGAPCSGKTTFVNSLRVSNLLSIPILEMDEEIRHANGGEWPEDNGDAAEEGIYHSIATMDHVIYFTSYVPEQWIQKMKNKGFFVIQLSCPLDKLLKRFEQRMSNDPTLGDERPGVIDNLSWQKDISEKGLIDFVIDTSSSLEISKNELLAILRRLKILVVCSHGRNRSVFLKNYLLSNGYDVEAIGVNDEHLDEVVKGFDIVISVHPHVLAVLKEKVNLSDKQVISLDVEDRPEYVLPAQQMLDGQEWIDFQNTHVYPKLIEQIEKHMPFERSIPPR